MRRPVRTAGFLFDADFEARPMEKRQQNREAKREVLIEAGLARILTHPMDLLRSALNASTLSADVDMPKDTAYRQFRGEGASSKDAIVRAVARAAARPGWSGFDASADQIAGVFGDAVVAERPFKEALIEAMTANIEAQYSALGGPVGWIFHSAAITASPGWYGGSEISEEDRRLGEELLAIRARFYSEMSDALLPILVAAMSLIGRRPRRGLDPRHTLAILHAMVDGAVLRHCIDPDAIDSTLVGEAMYAVALALTEDGALGDPRRPQTADGQAAFDRMVESAARSWPLGSERTVESTAEEAGVVSEIAAFLFPSTADLADSVIWTQVLAGGSLMASLEPHEDGSAVPAAELAMMLGLLRRLRDTVELLPGARLVIESHQAEVGIGIKSQLQREVAEILRRHCPGIDPGVTAAELVSSAIAGRPGWPTVTALMRVIDRKPDEPRSAPEPDGRRGQPASSFATRAPRSPSTWRQ